VSEGARRREILRAAERLLARYGPAKTTMADVAREARIGVGTVYLEFPSKEAIVEELSTARHEALLGAMLRAGRSEGRYRERLANVFNARTALLLQFADEGEHTCDLVHCMSPAVKAAQARYAEAELALLCGLLGEGARAREFVALEGPRACEAVARSLLCAYGAFTAPVLFATPRKHVRAALDQMHALVLYGLVARGGAG